MRLIAPTSMAVPEYAKVLQELPHRLGGQWSEIQILVSTSNDRHRDTDSNVLHGLLMSPT